MAKDKAAAKPSVTKTVESDEWQADDQGAERSIALVQAMIKSFTEKAKEGAAAITAKPPTDAEFVLKNRLASALAEKG